MRNELFREVVGFVAIVLAASFAAVLMMAAGSCLVSGREQGPSEVLTETARAYSDPALVPAPSDRAEDETMKGRGDVSTLDTDAPAPTSTVTQSALTREGGGTLGDPVTPYVPSRPTAVTSSVGGGALTPSASYTAIDSAPATPVATPARVDTAVPTSIKSYEPWPAYLWPTVACLIERESGGLEWKVSPGGDVGLMQVGPANFDYLAERGITRAMLFDGPTNLRAGWMLYQYWQGVNGDGLTPWKSTRGGCS